MRYAITLAAAAAALASSVVSAQAGCAVPGVRTSEPAHEIPGYIVAGMRPKAELAKPAITLPRPTPGDATHDIVGTWLVTYTVEGKLFGQAFIQWHDDGTEWENINLPLSGGNICVGSWKGVDSTHVTRFHVGWLYTAGVLTGYFTETENDDVRPTWYSGVNDQKIFDLKGNVLAEVAGTSSAVRIGP